MTAYPNEKELVERAKIDPEAFGILYQRYVSKIYTYIYYRTGNQHDAEDLTAKVFHQALNHIGRYKDKGHPFSAWLYRIAHNLVANWHRDQKKRQTVALEETNLFSGEKTNPYHNTVKNEETAILLEAIQQLPPVRQQLLILKFIDGLSNAEIGEILNRSEGAVKSLYHRTLVSLKSLLADYPELIEPLENSYDH